MPRNRRPLTLVDLMAAIGAAGLGLGLVTWLAPGRIVPMLILIPPCVGILWGRSRGGRGILGGTVGGAAYGAGCLVYILSGMAGIPRDLVIQSPGEFLVMLATCVAIGTFLGLTAWLVALAMGSSRGPVPVEGE